MLKKAQIVGLKYRAVPPSFLENLAGKEISFILEPENKFDCFAIKCVARGKHFGYVSKNSSALFTRLIKRAERYSIKIISFDEYQVDIEAAFDVSEEVKYSRKFEFLDAEKGHAAGIYEISFSRTNEQTACYIGQSTNINRRLKTHYADLDSNKHHNSHLQDAWNEEKSSFQCRILETCSLSMDEFEKQIWLFRKEAEYIKISKYPTVNVIDADLVLTTTARSKLADISNTTISVLKEKRKNAIALKESIGQVVINCGIMKEEKFWDGWQRGGSSEKKYLSVQASNVLTWLNKTRYGMFDYRPNIDSSHPRYDDLKEKLNLAHKDVQRLDREVRTVREFLHTVGRKGKYDTCKIESLEHFLAVVESAHGSKSEIPKKIIDCPNCSTKIRIPSNMKVKFNCPNCGKIYITK